MIYLWRTPDEYPEELIGEYVRSESPDRFSMRKGKKISDQEKSPVIRFGAAGQVLSNYSCLSNSAMLPLIRKDLAVFLLDNAPDDVQLIKAKVQAEDGEVDNFYLLNVTASVVGVDKSKSIFTYVPGTERIMGFRKLHYSDGCMERHMLARDAEYLGHLLVSNDIADKIKSRNFVGVGLYLPEDIV